MACNWKGCDAPLYAAGLCSKHYNRLRTTGSCEDGARARRPLSERLWKYIEKHGPDECWPWIGKSVSHGYGIIGKGGRSEGKIRAHRAVWEEIHGQIQEGGRGYHGWVVMHTCDNRLCCNPAHLQLATQADNVRDMDEKARRKWKSPGRGEMHPRAKYTEEQVRAVRRDTGTPTEIARRHGVPVGWVGSIRYNKAWKHIK